jgi:NTP pyrophosphatase (non-canonical NTP hydrolase)
MATGRTKRNRKYSRVFEIAFVEEKELSKQVDLNAYKEFVRAVTSEQSNSTSALTETLDNLENESGVNLALLMTGAIGIASEGGEFAEIVKKCIFQGKPLDNETIFHAKRELGDIMWYWISACRALNLDPNDVVAENVEKLKARYPGGNFDVFYSENRKEGDL